MLSLHFRVSLGKRSKLSHEWLFSELQERNKFWWRVFIFVFRPEKRAITAILLHFRLSNDLKQFLFTPSGLNQSLCQITTKIFFLEIFRKCPQGWFHFFRLKFYWLNSDLKFFFCNTSRSSNNHNSDENLNLNLKHFFLIFNQPVTRIARTSVWKEVWRMWKTEPHAMAKAKAVEEKRHQTPMRETVVGSKNTKISWNEIALDSRHYTW